MEIPAFAGMTTKKTATLSDLQFRILINLLLGTAIEKDAIDNECKKSISSQPNKPNKYK